MSFIRRTLILLILLVPVLGARAEDRARAEDGAFETELTKIAKEVSAAKEKGVGTKPYDDALSAIEQDIKSGKPENEIKKRLDSLDQALHAQLTERDLLISGVRFSFVS